MEGVAETASGDAGGDGRAGVDAADEGKTRREPPPGGRGRSRRLRRPEVVPAAIPRTAAAAVTAGWRRLVVEIRRRRRAFVRIGKPESPRRTGEGWMGSATPRRWRWRGLSAAGGGVRAISGRDGRGVLGGGRWFRRRCGGLLAAMVRLGSLPADEGGWRRDRLPAAAAGAGLRRPAATRRGDPEASEGVREDREGGVAAGGRGKARRDRRPRGGGGGGGSRRWEARPERFRTRQEGVRGGSGGRDRRGRIAGRTRGGRRVGERSGRGVLSGPR